MKNNKYLSPHNGEEEDHELNEDQMCEWGEKKKKKKERKEKKEKEKGM